MPIYEYRCESCAHELEKIQKMSDEAIVDCPACGRPALKRLISAAAFRLKGSGWYETDFKKDNKRNLADSAHGDSSAKSTPADGKPVEKASSDTTNAVKKPDSVPAAKPPSKESKNA